MLTPFLENGEVDYGCVKALTKWYIDSGAVGLFPVAQSGEAFLLSPDEVCRQIA